MLTLIAFLAQFTAVLGNYIVYQELPEESMTWGLPTYYKPWRLTFHLDLPHVLANITAESGGIDGADFEFCHDVLPRRLVGTYTDEVRLKLPSTLPYRNGHYYRFAVYAEGRSEPVEYSEVWRYNTLTETIGKVNDRRR